MALFGCVLFLRKLITDPLFSFLLSFFFGVPTAVAEAALQRRLSPPPLTSPTTPRPPRSPCPCPTTAPCTASRPPSSPPHTHITPICLPLPLLCLLLHL